MKNLEEFAQELENRLSFYTLTALGAAYSYNIDNFKEDLDEIEALTLAYKPTDKIPEVLVKRLILHAQSLGVVFHQLDIKALPLQIESFISVDGIPAYLYQVKDDRFQFAKINTDENREFFKQYM